MGFASSITKYAPLCVFTHIIIASQIISTFSRSHNVLNFNTYHQYVNVQTIF